MSTESFEKPPAQAGTIRQPPLTPAGSLPPSSEGSVRPVGSPLEVSSGTGAPMPGDPRGSDMAVHPASSASSERSLEDAAAHPRERPVQGAGTSPERSAEGGAASRERPNESDTANRQRAEAPESSRDRGHGAPDAGRERPEDASRGPTILVRGETVRDDHGSDKSWRDGTPAKTEGTDKTDDQEGASDGKLSEATLKMQSRLPALDDDADIGVQKEQVVIRDGKPDLRFTGTLIASAAPSASRKGKWEELRIYETSGGKRVFSRVIRTVAADGEDKHEADVFEPSPSSVPSQLLRSARELTRTRPLMWTDAAVKFFGYEPLAKELYRKLGDQFDEHVT